jgi:hypothetical protein
VQVYQYDYESDDILKPRIKIDSQIGVYKIKVRKIDKMKAGWPPVQQVEILIADVLKSFTVYYIRFEKNKSISNARDSMKLNGEKYRFPYGQWCTSMEKISHEISKQ